MISPTILSRSPFTPAGALRAFLAATCLLQALPAAAQTAGSSAFGESADLHLLPLLGQGLQVASGPLPHVTGSAPAPYSKSASVASASVSTSLAGSVLQTGVLSVNASSQVPGAVHIRPRPTSRLPAATRPTRWSPAARSVTALASPTRAPMRSPTPC